MDATQVAYAVLVYCRIQTMQGKNHMAAAKSRIAPYKEIHIPRLGLLVSTLGVRLM